MLPSNSDLGVQLASNCHIEYGNCFTQVRHLISGNIRKNHRQGHEKVCIINIQNTLY